MTQQAYLQFYRDSQAESYFDAKSDGSLTEVPVNDPDHAVQLHGVIQTATDMMEHRAVIHYFYKDPYGLHPFAIVSQSPLVVEVATKVNLLRQFQMSEDLQDHFERNGYWEHPFFTRSQWKTDVSNDDTIQGYWSWVYNNVADHGWEA